MSSVFNPSQLLINRNPPRSPAHPQLAPTSTSPQHATTWRPPRDPINDDDDDDEEEQDELEDEVIDVDPTFQRHASWPGTVKVVIGANEFWCHKDILVFGSPFFHSLLLGEWAETTRTRTRPASFSSSISVARSQFTFSPDRSEPSLDPASLVEHVEDEAQLPILALTGLDLDRAVLQTPKESIYHDAPEQVVHQDPTDLGEPAAVSTSSSPLLAQGTLNHPTAPLRSSSDPTLLQPPNDLNERTRKRKRSKPNLQAQTHTRMETKGADAVAIVDLVDERASVFQDFLRWIYPNLECKITWTNVEGLYTISDRLINNSLRQAAHSFLMTHASGKPITAMRVAELHDNAELYREASRFVLDLGAWVEEDMAVLSDRTRMKLLMRRNWFLDRLVKLQATDVRREYQCHPSCPDLANCQRLLDDKWRLAQATLSRYGSPQPSVAFRCLRLLETYPTNPSLLLTHTICQNTAKSWVMSLFDRMFQPRHSFPAGTEKYWLFVTLN